MAGIFDIKLKDENIKDKKVPGFSDKRYEGSFIGSGPLGPENSKIHQRRIGSPVKKNRVYTIAIICLVVVVFILSYVVYLQVFRGSYYKNIAEGNRIRTVPIVANRGLIYDRNKKALTENIANFSLTIVPGDLPKENEERIEIKNDLILSLEKVYNNGQPLNKEILTEINTIFDGLNYYDYRPKILIKKIDYLTSMKLMLVVDKIPGISLRSNAIRKYIIDNDNSFSHILGYVDNITEEEYKIKGSKYTITDFIGRSGLEKEYESELKGKNGRKRIEIDSLGREKKIESLIKPMSGKNIILSIDYNLQKEVIKILKKYTSKNKINAAAAVLLNPQNGEVLSIASWPTYNNNFFTLGTDNKNEYENMKQNPYKPFVFRAIAGEYPPGSTIKPLWGVAGLSEDIINQNTTVLSTGGIDVKQWFFADWKAGGHGRVNLVEALAESVNTFFYYLGGGYNDFVGLGIEKMKEYARLFGLTKKTGIDLPNESNGLVANSNWKRRVKNEPWYIGDTYHIAIGQGDILVTPIQVANYISAIANGGILYRPHLVNYIFSSVDNKMEKIDYKPIEYNLSDKDNIDLVKKGLKKAVEWGSARKLNQLDVEVAGKTGTAEIGGNKNPHSWFTGFAPFKTPEIAIAIIFENGGDGTKVAIPAAFDILQYWNNNIR